MHFKSRFKNIPSVCVLSELRYYGIVILILITAGFPAQDDVTAKVFGGRDPFRVRTFIENKGQYKDSLIKDQILFVYETGKETIYFTDRGLVHKHTKRHEFTEEEHEEMEKGHMPETKFMTNYQVNMLWKNSNSTYQIERSEKEDFYLVS